MSEKAIDRAKEHEACAALSKVSPWDVGRLVLLTTNKRIENWTSVDFSDSEAIIRACMAEAEKNAEERRPALMQAKANYAVMKERMDEATHPFRLLEERLREARLAWVEKNGTAMAKAAGSGNVSMRSWWSHEVDDPDMVPREFCSPDPKKIKQAIKDAGGFVSIPGVRVEKKRTEMFRKETDR